MKQRAHFKKMSRNALGILIIFLGVPFCALSLTPKAYAGCVTLDNGKTFCTVDTPQNPTTTTTISPPSITTAPRNVTGTVNSVTNGVSGAVQGAADAATGAVNNATGALSGAVTGATDAVNSATGALNDAAGTVNNAVTEATDAVNGAVNQATEVIDEVTGAVDGALAPIGGLEGAKNVLNAGKTALDLIKNPEKILDLAKDEAINFLQNAALDQAQQVLSSLGAEQLTELFTNLSVDGITAITGDLLGGLTGAAADAVNQAFQSLDGLIGTFPGAEQLVQSLQSSLTSAIGSTGVFGAGGVPSPPSSAACAASGAVTIGMNHMRLRSSINSNTSAQFTAHRQWMLDVFFKQQVLPALMSFTEQMSAVAMHQTMIFGTFLDAKDQLETQRLVQELQVEAHKDYQPSEDFCYFGTNTRSLASSEAKAQFNAYMLSRRQMARHLGQYNIGGALSQDEDKEGRWEQFKESFCDPQDNNWLSSQPASGLALACGPTGAKNPEFTNADVDYTRLIENPRTISLRKDGILNHKLVPGASGVTGTTGSATDQAVMALGNNLYGHNVLTRQFGKEQLRRTELQQLYLALRSVAAKRAVAENSFNSIVSMKSAGTTHQDNSGGHSGENPADTWRFLGSVLKELGIPDAEIQGMIGQEPSYYAQLEILGKKIYQSPNFFSNLYDTPTNIKRKSVAMKGIELMLDRAIYESQIRQEMVSSVLLSARLHEPFKEANKNLQGGR